MRRREEDFDKIFPDGLDLNNKEQIALAANMLKNGYFYWLSTKIVLAELYTFEDPDSRRYMLEDINYRIFGQIKGFWGFWPEEFKELINE